MFSLSFIVASGWLSRSVAPHFPAANYRFTNLAPPFPPLTFRFDFAAIFINPIFGHHLKACWDYLYTLPPIHRFSHLPLYIGHRHIWQSQSLYTSSSSPYHCHFRPQNLKIWFLPGLQDATSTIQVPLSCHYGATASWDCPWESDWDN